MILTAYMNNFRLNEEESKRFLAALTLMRESELARLLDIVESLVQELQQVRRNDDESPAAAKAAQSLLKCWNKEVLRILKMQHDNDAA